MHGRFLSPCQKTCVHALVSLMLSSAEDLASRCMGQSLVADQYTECCSVGDSGPAGGRGGGRRRHRVQGDEAQGVPVLGLRQPSPLRCQLLWWDSNGCRSSVLCRVCGAN